jgi:hypothetical protein
VPHPDFDAVENMAHTRDEFWTCPRVRPWDMSVGDRS